MTIFNRMVVILAAMILLAGSIITLLVATGATGPTSYGWFSFILDKAATATGANLALTIIVSIIIGLISLIVLILELSIPRQPTPLLINSSAEGVITINRESICILAERTASTVSNVRDVHCAIGEKVGGMVISCQAVVSLAGNVPEITAELQKAVKTEVEKLTGLPVAQIDVKTRYESSDARRLALQ